MPRIKYVVEEDWYKLYHNGKVSYVKTPTDFAYVKVCGYYPVDGNGDIQKIYGNFIEDHEYIAYDYKYDPKVKNNKGEYGDYVQDWKLPINDIKLAKRRIYSRLRRRFNNANN